MELTYFKDYIDGDYRRQIAHASDEFWRKWNKNKYTLGALGFTLFHEPDDRGKKIWYVCRTTKKDGEKFPEPVKTPPFYLRDKSNLKPYQIEPVTQLCASLLSNKFALDASDTGTGKTWTSLKTALAVGYQPAIICTKTGIASWRLVCKHLKINPVFICNWESSIGRIYKKNGYVIKTTQPPNKYISMTYDNYTGRPIFEWLIPRDAKVVIIFDEIHKANGNDTSFQRLVRSAQLSGHRMIGLSATACDKVKKFRMLGSLLGLFEYDDFDDWMKKQGCFINNFNEWEPINEKEIIKKISAFIFPNYGARVKKDDVPGFPECQNIAGLYEIDKSDLQNKKFAEMEKRIAALEAKRTRDTEFAILAERMKYRQIAETYKIPLLIDLAKEYVEAGHSVIIFTQFVPTLDVIVRKLKTNCYIKGGQKPDHRSLALADFGADRERIMVANIQAGGVAIDGLQDLRGEFSRVGLVCPTDDAVLLKQTLGRIHRSNSKSKSMNILVYAARTVEEKIFENVNSKIANINLLNDGDLAEMETFK